MVIAVYETAYTFIYVYQNEWTLGNDSEYQMFNNVCMNLNCTLKLTNVKEHIE